MVELGRNVLALLFKKKQSNKLYGGKVAYHVYDDIVTYWQESGGSASALRRIVNDKLGRHLTDVQDMLSRNALLSVPYKLFGGSATNFATLGTEDKLTTPLLDTVHLGMQYREQYAA